MSGSGDTHLWQCHRYKCQNLNKRSGENEKCEKCNEIRIKRCVFIFGETISSIAWTCVKCNFDSKYKAQCSACKYDHFSEYFVRKHTNISKLHNVHTTSSTPDLSHPSAENTISKENGQRKLERSGSESKLGDMKAFCQGLKESTSTLQAFNPGRIDLRSNFAYEPKEQGWGNPVNCEPKSDDNRKKVIGFDPKNGGARPKTPKGQKGICKCTFRVTCKIHASKGQEKAAFQEKQPTHTFVEHKGKEEAKGLCLYLPNDKDKFGIQPDSQRSPNSELRMYFTAGWVCRDCMIQVEMSDICEGCKGHKNNVEFKGPLNEFLNTSTKLSSSLKENLFKKHDEAAKKSFTRIIQYCEKYGCQFEDEDFCDAAWKRCTLISTENDCDSPKEWQIYNDEPEPSDIQQGILDNCWLLSALTVISGRKDLLDKIILTKDVTYHGVYQIRLCKDGMWQTVTVDDTFPCDAKGRLKYSKAKRKQLWVPLVEKAVAKLHGGYDSLHTGSTLEALSLLTGHPCEYKLIGKLGTSDHHETWQFLLDAKKGKYLMSASTPEKKHVKDEKEEEEFCKTGLSIGHAYSVLDVQDVEKEKLINLRNPWGGQSSWKGDWHDTCDKWSQICKKRRKTLLRCGNAQGIFWMCLSDFIRYFVSIEVCKTRESGWHEVRLPGTFPRNTAQPWKFVVLTVDKKTDFHVGLHQKNLRGKQDQCSGEPLLDLMVVVLKKGKDSDSSVEKVVKTNARDARSFVGYDVSLEKGTYVIASLAFKQWKPATSHTHDDGTSGSSDVLTDYTLVIHSMQTICYQEVNTNDEQYEHILADIVIRLAVDRGTRVQIERDVSLYEFKGYGAFYVIENNSGKYAEVNLELMMKYVKSTRTRIGNIVQDIVPGYHRQVLNIATPFQHDFDNWKVDGECKAYPINGRGCVEKHDPEIDPASEKLYIPRKIKK